MNPQAYQTYEKDSLKSFLFSPPLREEMPRKGQRDDYPSITT